ncbi:MAG TPA: hypothetical protein V6C64_08300 [Microcoleaceae cyanobacterium]
MLDASDTLFDPSSMIWDSSIKELNSSNPDSDCSDSLFVLSITPTHSSTMILQEFTKLNSESNGKVQQRRSL